MSGRLLPGDSVDWFGGVVTELAECVLAPNASAWTLDGTNTWIIGAEGGSCVIVDPGPLGSGHREAIDAVVEKRNGRPTSVLLTHGHHDHSEGAVELANAWGIPVRAWDPRMLDGAPSGSRGFSDRERLEVQGGEVHVTATPGHSSDSVCFIVGDLIVTGDTVLGRGTSVVAYPDGQLGPYLRSLNDLAKTCRDSGTTHLLPGHGPVVTSPATVVETYLSHRHERLREISDAMAQGAVSAEEIVDRVYRDIPVDVRPAALATVLAQLEFLQQN